MKKFLLSLSACVMSATFSMAQGYSEPFTGSTTLSTLNQTTPNPAYTFTQNNQLNVTMVDSTGPDQNPASHAADNWKSFYITFPAVNMATGKSVSVKITNPSASDMILNIQMQDANGVYTDDASQVTVPANTSSLTTVTLNLTNKFHNLYGGFNGGTKTAVDSAHITQINFLPVGAGLGAAPWNKKFKGDFVIDDIAVGGVAVTGILSSSVSNNMSITPNPASSEAVVSYNASASNVTFNVTDVTGKVVKSVAGNGTSANINVSDLSKGMYFVTTISNNTPVSVSKLVVE